MLPQTPAALRVRRAVRAWLAEHADGRASVVAVAVSGGADSLALAAAAAVEAAAVHALVVDHRLQDGSDVVAAEAAAAALRLGCFTTRVLPVDVDRAGGLEAAARRARYAALDTARDGLPVLLGHTLDDQAETVLLGLARGSGGRSIQGMAPVDPPWARPLLGVRRADTRELCQDLGVQPHEDPHNSAPDFTRVRLRTEVLPLLEEVLGGGVAPALARTAAHLQEDNSVLDEHALALARRAADPHDPRRAPVAMQGPSWTGGSAASAAAGLSVDALAAAPAALRRRAVRAWLLECGVSGFTDANLRAVDALVTEWRGQGPVAVAGGSPQARLVVQREHGRLTLALRQRSS